MSRFAGAKPGDEYVIVMGDSPPVVVESGIIGDNGERIRDIVPMWRGCGLMREYYMIGCFAILILGLIALATIAIGGYLP
jgi:hypothetical protein